MKPFQELGRRLSFEREWRDYKKDKAAKRPAELSNVSGRCIIRRTSVIAGALWRGCWCQENKLAETVKIVNSFAEVTHNYLAPRTIVSIFGLP